MRQAEIIWENAGKLTCKWLRNMNHKIQATKKNALMHETTRVSIRVKPMGYLKILQIRPF